MFFINPMWNDETERLGKRKSTPLGYALHVTFDLIGYRKGFRFDHESREASWDAGLSKHLDLKLVDRKQFASGAVALKYEPTR